METSNAPPLPPLCKSPPLVCSCKVMSISGLGKINTYNMVVSFIKIFKNNKLLDIIYCSNYNYYDVWRCCCCVVAVVRVCACVGARACMLACKLLRLGGLPAPSALPHSILSLLLSLRKHSPMHTYAHTYVPRCPHYLIVSVSWFTGEMVLHYCILNMTFGSVRTVVL